MEYMSQNIDQLATALAKAQPKFKAAHKNKTGYGYKYADMESVIDSCIEVLGENGLSVSQYLAVEEGMNYLITVLQHSSGQWIKSQSPLFIEPMNKMNKQQALGSAVTYQRRYAFSAIVGVAFSDDTDDDGVTSGPKTDEVIEIKPKKEEPKPRPKQECITDIQLGEFKKIWDLCSDDHRKTRTKILKAAPHHVNTLAEMPKNIYEKELELAKLNAQLQEVADV